MNVPQHWRMNTQRYQLRGTRHEDGSVSFPPRPEVEQRHEERYVFENIEDREVVDKLRSIA